MAITVSFTPNVSSFIQGDALISVSMSGTPVSGYNDYFWESDNGTFSSYFSSNPVFTPNNATKASSIIGRRVKNFLTGIATPANFAVYGSFNGKRKIAGSSSTWETATSDAGLGGEDGFFEFEIAETNCEKAGGLTANASYSDPTVVHPTNSFLLSWHFSTNGTVVVRKQGSALTAPIYCAIGDVYRVEVKGTKSIFLKNGVKITETTTPAGNLFAIFSFRTIGSIVNNPRVFATPVSNEGVKVLQVYGLFPVQPNYSLEINQDNVTLVSFAEDRSSRYKLKSGIKKNLSLQFLQRTYADYLSLNDFWKRHQKHISFYYKDIDFAETYLMVFDSGIRIQVNSPNSVTINCVLREV